MQRFMTQPWGAGVAQQWEQTPPTNVARVWFLNLLLVLFLHRSFSLGTPLFPSPQKPTLPNSNSIQNAQAHIEWAPERP